MKGSLSTHGSKIRLVKGSLAALPKYLIDADEKAAETSSGDNYSQQIKAKEYIFVLWRHKNICLKQCVATRYRN